MASQPNYPLLTAEAFLEIDFGDRKAELANGVIHMMAGGTRRHSDVQTNIVAALREKLRGSGCRAHGPDMAVRTHDHSIRYPDVSVFCDRSDPAFDDDLADAEPRIVFEVLSNGTARTDLRVKLDEYKALPSVDTIVFVDIGTERLRIVQRTGPTGWTDESYPERRDVVLPARNLTVGHDDIFSRK